jgi:hypothetical protein
MVKEVGVLEEKGSGGWGRGEVEHKCRRSPGGKRGRRRVAGERNEPFFLMHGIAVNFFTTLEFKIAIATFVKHLFFCFMM